MHLWPAYQVMNWFLSKWSNFCTVNEDHDPIAQEDKEGYI